MSGDGNEMSFLDHLEELRWHLVRSLVAILVITITTFALGTLVFDYVILAPNQLDFITYRALCWLSTQIEFADFCLKEIGWKLHNKEFTGQFLVHIKVSFVLGIVLSFPYVFWEFWRFIKPALYDKETKVTRGIVFFCSVLFMLGVCFGFFILVPFSLNFLGNYHVSKIEEVENFLTLDSYIGLLTMLVLASGIIFELPMVVFLLSKVGIITPKFMRKYRKHALVIILILSAIITPPDVTSQVLISIPLLILYEISIFISARVDRKRKKRIDNEY